MTRFAVSLSVIASLALASSAYAQDTQTGTGTGDTEEPAAETPAQTEAPSADSQLDLGQSADAGGPQVGQRYSKQKFGDWDLACVKSNTDKDPCSLLQLLKDPDGNPVAEVSLFRIEGGGQAVAGATIVVPLETWLPAQLTIAVDGGTGKKYSYSFCNQVGCVAQIGLTQEDVNAFKRGSKATLSLVPAQAPDQVVTLDMSLSGFTAGYNVVDVVTN